MWPKRFAPPLLLLPPPPAPLLLSHPLRVHRVVVRGVPAKAAVQHHLWVHGVRLPVHDCEPGAVHRGVGAPPPLDLGDEVQACLADVLAPSLSFLAPQDPIADPSPADLLLVLSQPPPGCLRGVGEPKEVLHAEHGLVPTMQGPRALVEGSPLPGGWRGGRLVPLGLHPVPLLLHLEPALLVLVVPDQPDIPGILPLDVPVAAESVPHPSGGVDAPLGHRLLCRLTLEHRQQVVRSDHLCLAIPRPTNTP
mmetsp:Transcript_8340/g.28612  ORF Transcript_8340/g.28612 Transcript_8340/m.28612 type:complete len:250 (-) Transcript_8340:1761-2510(-)